MITLEVCIGTWKTQLEMPTVNRSKAKIQAIREYKEETESKIPVGILIQYARTRRVTDGDDGTRDQIILEELEETYRNRELTEE